MNMKENKIYVVTHQIVTNGGDPIDIVMVSTDLNACKSKLDEIEKERSKDENVRRCYDLLDAYDMLVCSNHFGNTVNKKYVTKEIFKVL